MSAMMSFCLLVTRIEWKANFLEYGFGIIFWLNDGFLLQLDLLWFFYLKRQLTAYLKTLLLIQFFCEATETIFSIIVKI